MSKQMPLNHATVLKMIVGHKYCNNAHMMYTHIYPTHCLHFMPVMKRLEPRINFVQRSNIQVHDMNTTSYIYGKYNYVY